jgi:acyl-CoA hydrolase
MPQLGAHATLPQAAAHTWAEPTSNGFHMSGQQRALTMRFLAEPTDVNYGGKVHGGIVMKWIDQAGYAAAVGWSGRYSVTVAVGGIRFVAPIRISDLVTVTATLVYTGTSSMHFSVDVSARDPMQDEAAERLCTHCMIVFVALDGVEGKPAPVPAWTPRDDEDKRLAEYATQVMALSTGIEDTVARYRVAELH